MRVVLAIVLAAGISAAQARAQGRGLAGVIEDPSADAAPNRRAPPPPAPSASDAARVLAAHAANDRARALLGADLSKLAVQHLRRAIERGDGDAETYYLLATSLRAEAEALRRRAEGIERDGYPRDAARVRREADEVNAEAMEQLVLGRDHAHRILRERLASGDLDGVRRMASALVRADPDDERASEALASVGLKPSVPDAPTSVNAPWDGTDATSPWNRFPLAEGFAPPRAPVAAAAPRSAPAAPPRPTTRRVPLPPLDEPAPPPAPRPVAGRNAPVDVTESDLEVLARIVKGEAAPCSFEGKVAVAAVVLNRVRTPGFPKSIRDVAHQPGQFGCYAPAVRARLYGGPIPPECLEAAKAAVAGQDPSRGATYFFNPNHARPAWAREMELLIKIGQERDDTFEFYRPRSAG